MGSAGQPKCSRECLGHTQYLPVFRRFASLHNRELRLAINADLPLEEGPIRSHGISRSNSCPGLSISVPGCWPGSLPVVRGSLQGANCYRPDPILLFLWLSSVAPFGPTCTTTVTFSQTPKFPSRLRIRKEVLEVLPLPCLLLPSFESLLFTLMIQASHCAGLTFLPKPQHVQVTLRHCPFSARQSSSCLASPSKPGAPRHMSGSSALSCPTTEL